MPTPYTGEVRKLPYPLDRAVALEVEMPAATGGTILPAFPDDPDEIITVFFRWSLNNFIAMATAIDVGRDPAYSTDGDIIWWIWATSIMADLCSEVAECITNENPALVDALANLIANNAQIRNAINAANAENGGSTPGMPITQEQAEQDLLPANVKTGDDCDLDALWGACLYLVQSANRSITDAYEQIEVATNTLEAMAIGAEVIPAAGNYVSAAAQFADQLLENITEGYAGAYTEEYEQQLACMLFCIAKDTCELNLAIVIDRIGARLDFTEVLPDFGVLMTEVGAGTWSGDSIADVSFWIYFAALRFGQVYGGTIGIRPLTVLMSLGADQLASDNWEALCDCPVTWTQVYDFTIDEQGWTGLGGGTANYVAGNGWAHEPPPYVGRLQIKLVLASPIDIETVRFEYTSPTITGDTQTVTLYQAPAYTPVDSQGYTEDVTFVTPFTSDLVAVDTVASFIATTDPIPGYLFRITLTGTGTPPPAP